MKKISKALSALAVATAALCAAGSANAAIVFSFTPSSQHVAVGDTVNVAVSISGLGNEVLSGFDLNFFYNSSVLGLSERAINFDPAYDELGAGFPAPTELPYFDIDVFTHGEFGVQAAAGFVGTDEPLEINQADSFLLGSFTLSADSDGVSTFGLGLNTSFERNFVGLNAESLTVQVGSACIAVGTGSCEVAPVPEPASFALAGVALLAAGVAGRNRRRARAEA